VITNYEAVVRKLEVLQDIPWSVVIIDEAQAFKNRRARRTKAVFALRRKIPHVWLITATPIMNRPEELWSLLHIIKPKQYSSYWRFINEHCNTIQNLWGGTEVIGIRDPAGLEQELAPLILRRNKKLLNLPPLTQETIYLEMSGEQKRIYKQLERDFIVRLDDEGEKFLSAPDILAQLIRLRQIACNPALVGGPDSSIKDAALLNLLDNLAGDYKVLVFTTFAGYVKHLWPKLQRYFPASIYGDMNIEDRWRNAATFQTDPACRVLLGTIGAMSKGLNLQAADVVILLDQDWVPASMEIQAIGRAHRRGQEKPVHAINLVCQGTVDEYIHQTILPKKREVIRAITQLMRGQKEGG
jgi:SNF2 family DNA or RNA helicase